MSDYELGARVRMTGTVRKAHPGRARTEYHDAPLPVIGKRTITDGVVVGKRTVVSGKTTRPYIDEPSCFTPDPHSARVVYLVAFHLSRKPVMCSPDQIAALDREEADRG